MTMDARARFQRSEYPTTRRRERGRYEPAEARLWGLYLDEAGVVDHLHDLYLTEPEGRALFSLLGHTHTPQNPAHTHPYSPLGHLHSQYLTEPAARGIFSLLGHSHNRVASHSHPLIAHTHDDRYYQKVTVDATFARKNHEHEGGGSGTQGPQGPAGPRGATGPRGPQGPRGTTGARGATGPRGPQGLRGLTGARGPAGPQGPRGLQGLRGPAGTGTGSTGDSGFWQERRPNNWAAPYSVIYSTTEFITTAGIAAHFIGAGSYISALGHPSIGASGNAYKFDAYLRNIDAVSVDTRILEVSTEAQISHMSGISGRNTDPVQTRSGLIPTIHYADSSRVWIGESSRPWRRGYFDQLWVGGRKITGGSSSGGTTTDISLTEGDGIDITEDDGDYTIAVEHPLPNPSSGSAGQVPTVNNSRTGYILSAISGGDGGTHPHNFAPPHTHPYVRNTTYNAHVSAYLNHVRDYENHSHPAGTSGVPSHTHSQHDVTGLLTSITALSGKTLQNEGKIDDHIANHPTGGSTSLPDFAAPTVIRGVSHIGRASTISRSDHVHGHTGRLHEINEGGEITGDNIRINYTPSTVAYVPTPSGVLTDRISQLNQTRTITGHLRGIGAKLLEVGQAGVSIPWLAVPSDVRPDNNAGATDARDLGSSDKRWDNFYARRVNSDSVTASLGNLTRVVSDEVTAVDMYMTNLRAQASGGLNVRENLNMQEHVLQNLPNIRSVRVGASTFVSFSDVLKSSTNTPSGSLWLGEGERSQGGVANLLDLIPAIGGLLAGAANILLSPSQSGKLFIRLGTHIYVFESTYSLDASDFFED